MSIPKPHFALTRIYDDGTQEEPELLPVTTLPVEANMGRRGFLGAGLTLASVLKLMPAAVAAEALPAGADPFAPRSGLPPADPFAPVAKEAGAQNNNPARSTIPAHAGKVLALVISPDGRTLVSGGSDRAIKFWSLPERALLHKRDGSAGAIMAAAISPDGGTLATGSEEVEVRLWRMRDGAFMRNILGHAGWVGALAFSADGQMIAAGGGERPIRLHHLADATKVHVVDGDPTQVLALAFDPASGVLASGGAGQTVKLWNVAENKLLAMMKKHRGLVHAVAFSPDGELLASGSFDRTIVLWNVAKRTVRAVLTGHEGNVNALAIHPKGGLLASASSDGTIKLWSLPDGALRQTLRGHTDAVWSLAMSPDGSVLASGGFDGTICLWDLVSGANLGDFSDLGAAPPTVSGVTYNRTSISGQTVTFTLPCGSPIPAGAVCTCNCVPGTYIHRTTRPVLVQQPPGMVRQTTTIVQQRPPMQVASPQYGPHSKSVVVKPASRPSGGSSYGGSICTCNRVCVCIPVCQAHRLLHPDAVVRTMAEELLRWMGECEFPYMEWAARRAPAALRAAIKTVMRSIRTGATARLEHWPDVAACVARLHDPDEIIGIMAAQMISLRGGESRSQLDPGAARRVDELLTAAERRPWYLRER